MVGNQDARIRKVIAIGIHMIRVNVAFVEDNPVSMAGAIEIPPITNAIKTSHTQP